MLPPRRIRALAAKIDEQRAREILTGGAFVTGFRNLTGRTLTRLALVYVPFCTFEAQVESVTFRERYQLSIEANKGALDPYRSERPDEIAAEWVDAPNCVPAALSEQELHRRLIETVRRSTYLKGFHRIRRLSIAAERQQQSDFSVPFWLGFYGQNDLSIRVLNANNGKRDGAKASALFYQWLVQP
jgi:hypothetical protein